MTGNMLPNWLLTQVMLSAGSEAGEDSWAVEEPVPECHQEPPPPGCALLPGQHGRRTVCTSIQVHICVWVCVCVVCVSVCTCKMMMLSLHGAVACVERMNWQGGVDMGGRDASGSTAGQMQFWAV